MNARRLIGRQVEPTFESWEWLPEFEDDGDREVRS